MSPTSEVLELVPLCDGPVIPIAPYRLIHDLEDRGFVVTVGPDDVLSVQPGSRLTADDREAITRWKRHLVALMRYTQNPPRVA